MIYTKLSDLISEVKIKLLNDNATVPTSGTKFSAGYDLYSTENYTLMPMERRLFKVGFSIAIPNGMYGRIAPRSGLALKSGIDVLAGVIDSDYRDEIGVILINLGETEKNILIGDRIAQIIFELYNYVSFNIVENLDSTERGTGGFGSTDIQKITPKPPIDRLTISELYERNSGFQVKTKYIDEIKTKLQST